MLIHDENHSIPLIKIDFIEFENVVEPSNYSRRSLGSTVLEPLVFTINDLYFHCTHIYS